MSIVDDLIPTHYKLLRIGLQKSNGGIIAIGDLAIYNAAGKQITVDNPVVVLTSGEEAAVLGFVTRNLTNYETATGLEPLPSD
jgi:hypothetical protein